jgi:hypothetical protein
MDIYTFLLPKSYEISLKTFLRTKAKILKEEEEMYVSVPFAIKSYVFFVVIFICIFSLSRARPINDYNNNTYIKTEIIAWIFFLCNERTVQQLSLSMKMKMKKNYE